MKVYLATVLDLINYFDERTGAFIRSDERTIAEGVFSTAELAGDFLKDHGVIFQDNRWKGDGKLFGDLVEFELNVPLALDMD